MSQMSAEFVLIANFISVIGAVIGIIAYFRSREAARMKEFSKQLELDALQDQEILLLKQRTDYIERDTKQLKDEILIRQERVENKVDDLKMLIIQQLTKRDDK